MAEQLGLVIPQLLTSEAQLADLEHALAETDRVALDTEFHPERRRTPLLHLVSLATPAGTWLVDPHVPGLLERLRAPLSTKTWVVHGGRYDLVLMEPRVGRPAHVVDTQILAGLCTSLYPARLEQLLEGDPFARGSGQTMSDWSQRPLTRLQRAYAADDVLRLLDLAADLEERVHALGRSHLATEAMQAFAEDAYGPQRTDPLGFRGRRQLSPREAAILDEILWWRDLEAEAQDSTPTSILGDGHVLDLAKRAPSTLEAVSANRRFPNRIAQQYGRAFVDIVHRVHRRPEALLPRTAPRGSAREARLVWWRAQSLVAGLAHQWAAELALPDAVLERVVDGEALDGWRATLLGPWVQTERMREPARE
ncbi:MAG: hypothetical protein EP330_05560 [Deltaproteobacteria bacterium]|nr:MAG: hypothetical protein EP330_05560 [Deltaproteobacteria bacterium]